MGHLAGANTQLCHCSTEAAIDRQMYTNGQGCVQQNFIYKNKQPALETILCQLSSYIGRNCWQSFCHLEGKTCLMIETLERGRRGREAEGGMAQVRLKLHYIIWGPGSSSA